MINICLVNMLEQQKGGPSYNEVAHLALEGKTRKAARDLLPLLSSHLSGVELLFVCFLISLNFNTLIVHEHK